MVCEIERHRFLSRVWIEKAQQIQQRFNAYFDPTINPVIINFKVTEVPFDSGEAHGYLDTSNGYGAFFHGLHASPALTVFVEYFKAQELIFDQDYGDAMQAYMIGDIDVDGDFTLLLELSPEDPSPAHKRAHQEFLKELRAITAD